MTTHIYENLAVLLRTCVPTFRTHVRSDSPETPLYNRFPSESPLHFAGRRAESVIVGYYTSAEVPFPRRRQPGVPLREPFVRRTHIAHGRCEQGFQGAQYPWHTALVQSLVCYTLIEVYMFLKCKKPHTQHLDGADMGLDASSA